MGEVLVQYVATIYDSNGESVTVKPHEDCDFDLIVIEHTDGDSVPIRMVLLPETALALSSALTRVIALNAKAKT